jgi:hypothetical protein
MTPKAPISQSMPYGAKMGPDNIDFDHSFTIEPIIVNINKELRLNSCSRGKGV